MENGKRSWMAVMVSFVLVGITVLATSARADDEDLGNDFVVTQKTCKALAKSLPSWEFSQDYNGALFHPYKLDEGDGVQFTQAVQFELSRSMDSFCAERKSGMPSAAFKDAFHASCSTECQGQKQVFIKKGMFGGTGAQDHADGACMAVCSRIDHDLTMFQSGYGEDGSQSDKLKDAVRTCQLNLEVLSSRITTGSTTSLTQVKKQVDEAIASMQTRASSAGVGK